MEACCPGCTLLLCDLMHLVAKVYVKKLWLRIKTYVAELC
jgi:hypothetical protein